MQVINVIGSIKNVSFQILFCILDLIKFIKTKYCLSNKQYICLITYCTKIVLKFHFIHI